MTFQIIEAVLSAEVAANGTVALPYPGNSVAADFDPAGAHLASCADAIYTSAGSDFALTFGGSTITFTNGASNVTLPAGATLRVQMAEFVVDEEGAAQIIENLVLGASGQAGTLNLFPATPSTGKLAFRAVDNAGDFTTVFGNAPQAGVRTYLIPDAGESADFVMTKGGQSPVLKDVDAGASGNAGSVDVFPSTAAKGKIAIEAADSAGDHKLTLTNASMGAARTVTIPDPGAAAEFIMSKGVQSLAGVKTFTEAIALDSGQITFPGTAVPSAGVNTLDDYEEGTWTPVLVPGSGSTQTYTLQIGSYTKIGRMVFLKGHISINSLGDASGDIGIGGLPFPSSSDGNSLSVVTVGHGASLAITAGHALGGFLNPSSSEISLRVWDDVTGTTAMQASELTAGGAVSFAVNYYI